MDTDERQYTPKEETEAIIHVVYVVLSTFDFEQGLRL